MPAKAEKYMDDGAGKGVGLAGDGSHFAGEPSEATATSGSGQPTRSASPSGSDGGNGGTSAAPGMEIPVKMMSVVAAGVLFGAALLF
jgi:hypothetical protein